MISRSRLEFGDYQTPPGFCDLVVNLVSNKYKPKYIFEPTFGLGHFIDSSIKRFNNIDVVFGNEINREYFNRYKNSKIRNLELFNENIFSFNHKKIKDIIKKDYMLIIGNPPWVTNSQMMAEDLKNIPQKSNYKNLRGIDSITGASNFDISEYILVDLLNNYKDSNIMIAMLCKTSVAVNIMKNIHKYSFNLKNIELYLFDAKKIFNVDCNACLFVAEISKDKEVVAKVHNIDEPNTTLYEFGWKDGKFYSEFQDLENDIDGVFYTERRQGLKHDCSNIMELDKVDDNVYRNKLGETIILEDKYVYPLLKSSDFKVSVITQTNRYVIVPQRKIKEDTNHIEYDAPNTWKYLKTHEDSFNNRKSSIYKNSPPFSIFGIGDYSFSKYKVAISGFYKLPKFILLSSEKPIMLDDTCYFIGFDNLKEAYITMVLLNSDIVKNFLSSIAFKDKKRPYTKDVLMRIDIKRLVKYYNYDDFIQLGKKYNSSININEKEYNNFTKFLNF